MNGQAVLKQYFGYDTYREGQEKLVQAVLSGQDVLGVMPTGAGKSLCYQIPALMLPGISLVISPLVSLMKDQVMALVKNGVKAAFVNSSLTPGQIQTVMRRAREGWYKIIYIAPERLSSPDFLDFASKSEISLVTVDEAHCVSQWGHDFRTSYLEIIPFIESLPKRPVLAAFTATATAEVREDILGLLALEDPFVQVTGFDRKNLYFSVKRPEKKLEYLLGLLRERDGESIIIYCATRKNTDMICEELTADGFAATRYHAGLSSKERQQNQEDFVFERKKVMVATNAFGMGIDKSNVRGVIHYNMPKNIESYYQEAGRAGRDGDPAFCMLLYSPQDVPLNQFLIRQSEAEEGEDRDRMIENNLELLRQMTFYATTRDCLRHFLLRYFGESSPLSCEDCGNCDTHFEELDITDEAREIFACIRQLYDMRRPLGKSMVSAILTGSRNQRIEQMRLQTLQSYGSLKGTTTRRLHALMENLVERGYLMMTDSEYPVLALSELCGDVMNDDGRVIVKLPREEKPEAKKKGKRLPDDGLPLNEELFEKLRALRTQIAANEHVPAYFIFSDATLRDMCRKAPRNLSEFSEVSGVGKAKLAKYGEAFLEVLTTED